MTDPERPEGRAGRERGGRGRQTGLEWVVPYGFQTLGWNPLKEIQQLQQEREED